MSGVRLGPNSPLLTKGGRRRQLGPSEADEQKALVTLLVGRALPGFPRVEGEGLTGRFPDLLLLYAINPNKGGNNSVAARGMAKAMGGLAGMPDLHLPVARGAYHSLYVEVKRKGGRVGPDQQIVHDRLRRAGNFVTVCYGAQEALNDILSYLGTE